MDFSNKCDNCVYNVPPLVIDGNIINGQFCSYMQENSGFCIYDDEDVYISSED